MKTKLCLCLIAFSLSGCNAVNKLIGGSENSPPPAGTPHIQAVWIADVNVDGASNEFHFILEDKGAGNIAGIWNLNWQAQGHVRATLSGDSLSFHLDTNICPDAYTGSAMIAGNQMALSFSGPGCPGAGGNVPAVTLAQGTILWNGQP